MEDSPIHFKILPVLQRTTANMQPCSDLRVDFSQVVHISPEQQKIIARYPLEYLDVVLTIAGTIGAVGVVDEKHELCQFNENLARITNLNGTNPHYLAIYLDSRFGQASIKFLAGGAVQPKLSLENIAKIAVPLPPRTTQDYIAQAMRDVHSKRQEKLDQAEQLLLGIEKLILQELNLDTEEVQGRQMALIPISAIAGGRFDFGAVVTPADAKSDHTEPVLLNRVVNLSNERVLPATEFGDTEVNYIGLGNISAHTGELVEFRPVRGNSILSSSVRFRQGDILFGRMRPYLNKVWMAEFDGICSGEALVLRPDTATVDPTFLQGLLMSRIALRQIVPRQSGTSLPRVTATEVLSIELPIPQDIVLQKKIGAEIARRRTLAKQLRAEAEGIILEAEGRIERIILGEESVP